MCKIGRNHGWSNGPTMVALWVVRSILGGPFKIRVNFKSLHCWHMDFRMFFFCGLHTIVLEIDFKQNKASWKTLISFGDKKIWSPNGPPRRTSRSPRRFIGRLGRPGDLLFYTLLSIWFCARLLENSNWTRDIHCHMDSASVTLMFEQER